MSTAWPSAVTLMRAPGAGTRLTHTRTFTSEPARLTDTPNGMRMRSASVVRYAPSGEREGAVAPSPAAQASLLAAASSWVRRSRSTCSTERSAAE